MERAEFDRSTCIIRIIEMVATTVAEQRSDTQAQQEKETAQKKAQQGREIAPANQNEDALQKMHFKGSLTAY
ncbi:hypothetical protein H6G89_20725 [Oscillatoria sp. FACHB-1407]|uniref:hypothetical protein n=1 Tax=Oscillatoria sp. FACHB-1407 TaxID=2692847 RepID=UPI001686D1CF|nr:hypothetical protein [Oscillatoria sp. FACHB-1407]MBD2463437.1 hypothetical protein [Oscillatoria sp. FACHB-1407]